MLALPCALYPDIIGTLDLIFGSGMQVLGSALCILGLTWSLKKSDMLDDILQSGKPGLIHQFLYTWMQWIIPLALLAVLVNYIIDIAS